MFGSKARMIVELGQEIQANKQDIHALELDLKKIQEENDVYGNVISEARSILEVEDGGDLLAQAKFVMHVLNSSETLLAACARVLEGLDLAIANKQVKVTKKRKQKKYMNHLKK